MVCQQNTCRRYSTLVCRNLHHGFVYSTSPCNRDFDAPRVPAPRPADSSAATITANGLLLLAQEETNRTLRQHWIDNALTILSNTTKLAWKPRWESLLSNGTANRPANSFSTGIVYGASSLACFGMISLYLMSPR